MAFFSEASELVAAPGCALGGLPVSVLGFFDAFWSLHGGLSAWSSAVLTPLRFTWAPFTPACVAAAAAAAVAAASVDCDRAALPMGPAAAALAVPRVLGCGALKLRTEGGTGASGSDGAVGCD